MRQLRQSAHLSPPLILAIVSSPAVGFALVASARDKSGGRQDHKTTNKRATGLMTADEVGCRWSDEVVGRDQEPARAVARQFIITKSP
jgi:hypothetical protein